MTSAAITAIPRQTPISLAHMLGHEMESRPRSHGAPIVFVVDDDISVRESLEVMIGCEGWQPETFASAQEFLACPRALVPSCLVLPLCFPNCYWKPACHWLPSCSIVSPASLISTP
jgi:hypothetical protein